MASPTAWAAKKDGAEATAGQVEVLKVGFKNSLKATQVAIVENFNPGAVYLLSLLLVMKARATRSTQPAPKQWKFLRER